MSQLQIDMLLSALKRLPPYELRALLKRVFSLAGYEGGRTIQYFNQNGLALSLSYTRKGTVESLVPGPYLTSDNIAQLQEAVDDLSGEQQQHLASFFLFSDRPITGWWRYRDKFQILPPPENAPLPDELLGHWPFLLEATFSVSSKSIALMSRRMRATNVPRILLPVLLVGPQFQPGLYRPRKHWVITQPPSGDADWRPIYAQEYYDVHGRIIGGPALTDVQTALAAVVRDDEYYESKGQTGDEVLEVPESLTTLFDNYYAMTPELQADYLRACYWANLGQFLSHYSSSASFLALVVAIESLITKESPHRCNVCDGDHHPSLTAAFRKFLNDYVPDVADRDQLYDIRSKIAHGSRIILLDLPDEWADIHPAGMEERQQYGSLFRITRLAFVNWLKRISSNRHD